MDIMKKKGWNKYIKSKYWKRRKEQYWRKFPKICYCCGDTNKSDFIDLHHIVYSVFRERNKDLIPLCRYCHEYVHTLILNNNDINLTNVHIVRKHLLNREKYENITKTTSSILWSNNINYYNSFSCL